MSHEIYEALISAQLDGELSPKETAQLNAHLAVCPQCRAVRAELKAIHDLMLDTAAAPPPGLSERIMANLPPQRKKAKAPWVRRIAPLAAAAVVALVVIGVVKPSFNTGAPREEYAMAAETAEEEAAEAEEAAPELPMTEEPKEEAPAEEDIVLSLSTAGPSGQNASAPAEAPPQASHEPAAQQTAGASPDAKTESAPQAEAEAPQETAAADSLPAEPAAEESQEPEAAVSEAETVTEDAETETISTDAGGGAESESTADTIADMQPSSTLTWTQARERLCEYLGEVPDDLTAQDMTPDGKSWLFATRGKQYAVDRLSGAVTLLSSAE